MCNTCNTTARSCQNCCSNSYGCNGLFNLLNGNSCHYNGCSSWGGWGNQRICRDCNGNIWVRVSCGNSCCHNSCGCHNGCSCGCNNGGSTAGNASNGSGSFRCITFCGNSDTSNTASTLNGDTYYARQYGLYGSNRSCCGGSNY